MSGGLGLNCHLVVKNAWSPSAELARKHKIPLNIIESKKWGLQMTVAAVARESVIIWLRLNSD